MKKILLASLLIVSTKISALEISWNNVTGQLWVTQIWSSTDLVNWSLKATVPLGITNFPIVQPLPNEFFKVKNYDVNTGISSEWATTDRLTN